MTIPFAALVHKTTIKKNSFIVHQLAVSQCLSLLAQGTFHYATLYTETANIASAFSSIKVLYVLDILVVTVQRGITGYSARTPSPVILRVSRRIYYCVYVFSRM